jgi:hypothetical protein
MHRQEARRSSEGTSIGYIYVAARHGTATSPRCTNSPCTTILSPSPQQVSPPYHLAYQCAVAMSVAAVNQGRRRDRSRTGEDQG